jgi:hypothetical protein
MRASARPDTDLDLRAIDVEPSDDADALSVRPSAKS